MEYQGYYTVEELFVLVERDFPLIEKPSNDALFSVCADDLMRRIIEPRLEEFTGPKLSSEGVYLLYDEFSSLTSRAVQWFFPSLLRVILRDMEDEGLQWSLLCYLEQMDFENSGSAYNFSWLTVSQVTTLASVLEHLSEESPCDFVISEALANLDRLLTP